MDDKSNVRRRQPWPAGIDTHVSDILDTLELIRDDLAACLAEAGDRNRGAVLDITSDIRRDAVFVKSKIKAINNAAKLWQARHMAKGGRPPTWVTVIQDLSIADSAAELPVIVNLDKTVTRLLRRNDRFISAKAEIELAIAAAEKIIEWLNSVPFEVALPQEDIAHLQREERKPTDEYEISQIVREFLGKDDPTPGPDRI